ncbi:hypothetical protein ASG52_19305 [Methylobacterium sp. Leaf456]|nr:hypothetical protein ASG52_19305 [Methylobacterium sp. Leaf456]
MQAKVLRRVEACAVCRTERHLIEGELPQAVYPAVTGHEIVGTVEVLAPSVREPRLGVPG